MKEQDTARKEKGFKPYVPPDSPMSEFTLRALILGLIMSVILGAANAYLGLKAGMTIAATYPAAVIGMALLRIMKGSILEENMARTVGSIGESVAAGAIFTIPAFVIAGIWTDFNFTRRRYLEAAAIMIVGGLIGILFVTLLRRVMVEDPELPYPESVAASEIHKAGRTGGSGAKYLFYAMGLGALIQALGQLSFFAARWDKFVHFSRSTIDLRTGASIQGSGGGVLSTPGVSPAYIGVGYIIGPRLAALNFTGGLLAWGLFVPLLLFILGPQLEPIVGASPDAETQWMAQASGIWRFFVRPIAIGGMLMAAAYTLYRMRRNLYLGLSRSIADAKRAATAGAVQNRTEQDLNLKVVGLGVLICAVFTFFIYRHFSQDTTAAFVAMAVMLVAGFFFAAVSGYLVGLIGSSNNPISGLTLATLIIAALLMVLLGMKGSVGVAAVLGVAAVVCVSAAVAGEMLQDLKVGHILGGTPWKMQVGDIIGVILAGALMFIPLVILHQGDIKAGQLASPPYEGGFGSRVIPAPQASLMALLSQGIVGGQMAWPLIIVGMLMSVGFILLQVRSPMLVAVGMYLPLETTFAIFIGGIIRGIVDKIAERRQFNAAQRARTENNGILLASGLIAGEALIGLVFAYMAFREIRVPAIFAHPSFITSLVIFAIIALVLIVIPIKNAGQPDEPAPPSAVM
ncbi:MAG: oligopeptide transporter, OPT family [Acidobacteria bacterium]|nr:oligopeptide transporter, OPT family [Acidobacteriota bacterium]